MDPIFCICHDCHKYVNLGGIPLLGLKLIDRYKGTEAIYDAPIWRTQSFVKAAVDTFDFLARHRGHRISVTSQFNPRAKLEFLPITENHQETAI